MVTITQENVDKLNARIKINIKTEDYQPRIEQSLKQVRKQVDLKGFRKGMVPLGIVKKMHGNQILAEELNKLLNEELTRYLEDNKINILGSPLPDEDEKQEAININENKDYEFIYQLGLSPDFDLNILDAKTAVEQYKIKIDDTILKEETDRMRKQGGEMTNPTDALQPDDVIYVDLEELDDTGNVKEGGVTHSTAIDLDMIKDKAQLDKIMKLVIDESIQVDIFKLSDKSREEVLKHFLNMEDASIETGSNFRMTLKKINRVVPAEMNQEFFDKVFGKDTVKSESEFFEKLKEEMAKAYDRESEIKLHNDAIDLLLKEANINLPDDFLKRWILLSSENPTTPEAVEEQYEGFAKNLQWSLIVGKIKKEFDLEVTPEDIKSHTRETILNQFGLGESGMENEQLDEWVNTVMKNKEHLQKTYDYLLGNKIFTLIKEKLTINTKEVSLDTFKELNNAE